MSKRKYIYTGTIVPKLNPIYNSIAAFLTRKAEIDEEGINKIREYSEKGTVVYCSYQSSNLALLFLYKLLTKHNIKTPSFALEYNPLLLQRFSQIFSRMYQWVKRNIFRKKHLDAFESGYIEALIKNDESVLFPLLSQKFFLKRYLEKKFDSLLFLVDLQKKTDTSIFLFPHLIFWNRNPERSNSILKSKATGNKGLFSSLITSATPSYVKIMNPFDIKSIIEDNPDLNSFETALLLRDKLIEAYQQEKRIILGPVLRSKNEMMEKILYHPNVLKKIDELSNGNTKKQYKLKKKAYGYYKEIAADFSIKYVHFWEIVLNWMFKKIFSGINYNKQSLEKIREASSKGPVVLVPCHKSHMDYLILSYIFYNNKITPPHIAAGVNLSFFPVGSLFRHSGAFFIRRSFKGLNLYPVVFKQYLKNMVHEKYFIEFFIEGGRTRTGRLMSPKLGMMNYLVEAVDEGYSDDMVFMPISINYDRVLEENSYVKELKGKNKKKESVGGVLKSRKMLKRDYGNVYVEVGDYFTLKDIEAESEKDERVQKISDQIIKNIGQVISVNQVSLATSAMLFMSNKGFTYENLLSMAENLRDYFCMNDIPVAFETHDENIEKIIKKIISDYEKDGIIAGITIDDDEFKDPLFALQEESRAGIAFYKNTIVHYLLPVSILSLLLLKSEKEEVLITDIEDGYNNIMSLLSLEFKYEKYQYFNNSESHYGIKFLKSKNAISINENLIKIDSGSHALLSFYSRAISDIIESYFIVMKYISKFQRKLISEKDLISEIRKYGVRQYHTDKIRASEALSMPNYKTAIKKAVEIGALLEDHKSHKNRRYLKGNVEAAEVKTAFIKELINK